MFIILNSKISEDKIKYNWLVAVILYTLLFQQQYYAV